MTKKFILIVFIFQIFTSCGFTPTLKIKSNIENEASIYYEILNSSYSSRDILRNLLKGVGRNEADYLLALEVIESESAVNIESDGSVVEYRVEALVEYKLFNSVNDSLIYASQTRGLANYDVSNSEYNNALVKKEAEKTAISEAVKLMDIMIQIKINK